MKQRVGVLDWFYGLMGLGVVVTAGMMILMNPKLDWNYRLLAVQSGSMAPKIKPGSIVIVRRDKEYHEGEVISFQRGDLIITHRLVKVEQRGRERWYQTKGDANKEIDSRKVSQDQVVGKVVGVVPWLGWLAIWGRTEKGFIGLVVIPATIIIYTEGQKLFHEVKKRVA